MSERKDFRKRALVSEGDLYQLYADVCEIRREERREACMVDFRRLLKDAQFVDFTIVDKKERKEGTV